MIFRTVDIGGDKSLAYLRNENSDNDENPAMGWRALRLALEREGLMKAQARSLLEAAAGNTLNVMFPLVSEPWEFDAARAVFESQLAFLKARKKKLPERNPLWRDARSARAGRTARYPAAQYFLPLDRHQ